MFVHLAGCEVCCGLRCLPRLTPECAEAWKADEKRLDPHQLQSRTKPQHAVTDSVSLCPVTSCNDPSLVQRDSGSQEQGFQCCESTRAYFSCLRASPWPWKKAKERTKSAMKIMTSEITTALVVDSPTPLAPPVVVKPHAQLICGGSC